MARDEIYRGILRISGVPAAALCYFRQGYAIVVKSTTKWRGPDELTQSWKSVERMEDE